MLTAEQLRHYRNLLEAEKTRIEDAIEAWRQDIRDPEYTDVAGVDDIGDESVRILQQETDLEQIQRSEARLRQVTHALDRMEQGLYGLSEVSGRPIPAERLDAIPWTTTLVDESLPGDPN